MKEFEPDETAFRPIDYASTYRDNSFDKIVSEKNLVGYKSPEFIHKNYIGLISANADHKTICSAIAKARHSSWFCGLATVTQKSYDKQIKYFVQWLNLPESDLSMANRYEYLDSYVAYTVHEKGKKNSGITHIKACIKHGLEDGELDDREVYYLRHLLKLSKRSVRPKTEPYTLTDWLSVEWLRDEIGEQKFLLLESPARVFVSFRITIGVTLLYLLEGRNQWEAIFPEAPTRCTANKWWPKWNAQILRAVRLTKHPKSSTLSHLLAIDFTSQTKRFDIEGLESISASSFQYWQKPVVFGAQFHDRYSDLEQLLASWLAACEAIQPNDVYKLRKCDYAMEYNERGRLLLLQSNYYKGRSGQYKSPKVLMASDCWTKAFYQYMERFDSFETLIERNGRSQVSFPSLGMNAKTNTEVNFLLRLWQLPSVQKRLAEEFNRAGASSIFVDAMLGLENGDSSIASKRCSVGDYKSNYRKPLPALLFTLTHIKTTAIQANSDAYRDSDLINHHSHSSSVERISYLTDENKEWVNQCGRITRLVLHDLQNSVYKPSLERFQKKARELDLKTKVVQVTDSNDAVIRQSLNYSLQFFSEDEFLVVSDDIGTALYFIHYLDQAESNFNRLLCVTPKFVEQTLIIQIEWMTRTLQKMSCASEAHRLYPSYKSHLPSMFGHLFETTE